MELFFFSKRKKVVFGECAVEKSRRSTVTPLLFREESLYPWFLQAGTSFFSDSDGLKI